MHSSCVSQHPVCDNFLPVATQQSESENRILDPLYNVCDAVLVARFVDVG